MMPPRPDPAPGWRPGRTAPSWSYLPHLVPNGHALICLVSGLVGALFVSMPGGMLAIPGLAITGVALGSGRRALARARRTPWLGGRSLALAGLAAAAAGPLLLATWLALGVW